MTRTKKVPDLPYNASNHEVLVALATYNLYVVDDGAYAYLHVLPERGCVGRVPLTQLNELREYLVLLPKWKSCKRDRYGLADGLPEELELIRVQAQLGANAPD